MTGKGKSNRPVFSEKKEVSTPEFLRALGVTLSERLPTYEVPVELIFARDSNPNEMTDSEFNRLVEEIENTGMIDPVQIAPSEGGKFVLISGEHRWRGAVSLGYRTIPCNILLDSKYADDDIRDLLMVRMNSIRGKINPEKFAKLYADKAKKYGTDQLKTLFGYTNNDAWKKLTKGIETSMRKSGITGSKAIADEIAKRSGRIRTIDGISDMLKGLIKKYGNDLDKGFMVFTYGSKQHIYIAMDSELLSMVEMAVSKCKSDDISMTSFMCSAIGKHFDSLNISAGNG